MTHKLKLLFGGSALLLILHGIEEYFTGFYEVDVQFRFLFKPLFEMSVDQATFLLFQILLGIALLLLFLFTLSEQWRVRLLVIPGFFLFYEIHHIIMALGEGGYYPGLITSIFLPILGYFYWQELLKNFKKV